MTGAASTPATCLVAERTAQVKKDNSKEAGFMGIYEAVDQIVARKAPEWLAQGKRDKALDTARAFLAMGLSCQQVAQGTGLSIDEVEALL